MGMLNNPWFRVKIRRSHSADTKEFRVRFEHPTLAGNQAGGWMSEMKEHPSLTAPGVFVDPKIAAGRPSNIFHSSFPSQPPFLLLSFSEWLVDGEG